MVEIEKASNSLDAKKYVDLYKGLHPKDSSSHNTVYSLHLKFNKNDGSDLGNLLSSHLGKYSYSCEYRVKKYSVIMLSPTPRKCES
jgi:hypothetical protein